MSKVIAAKPSRNLGQLSLGRDNNLNLIRFLAATGVVMQHSAIIITGPEKLPIVAALFGMVSVWVFFVISGFLIARSFEGAEGPGDFIMARLLRIFPALLICILTTAFLVGPAMTELSLEEYFTSAQLWDFVAGNISLYWDVHYLPGVFATHPFSEAQITFWTLKHEVSCYVLILAIGCLGILARKRGFGIFMACFILLWGVVFTVDAQYPEYWPEAVPHLFRFALFFLLGTSAYIYRAHLHLGFKPALVLSIIAFCMSITPLVHLIMPIAIAYLVLVLAFLPRGAIRRFNALGDYSYGIYIFATPIQQIVFSFFGPANGQAAGGPDIWVNFGISAGPALLVAMLSWHLIEKPSMAARKRILARIGSRKRAIKTQF